MSVDDDQPQAESQGSAQPRDSEFARSVQAKVGDIANRWLKDRFGLRADPDGSYHFGDPQQLRDLGGRADQFVRGFFKGFLETPGAPESEAAGAPAPSMTEIMVKLLSRTGQTVNQAFQGYLRDNAVDAEHPREPVVLDAQFVVRHGAPLIGHIVQALGGAFSGAAPEEGASAGEAAKVDVKVELPEVFKTLLGGLAPGDGSGASAPNAARTEAASAEPATDTDGEDRP